MNLITLQTLKTGVVARNLLSYGTNDAALSALYNSMRASIADAANVASVTCLLMDDSGHVSKCERWVNTTVTPEPEEGESGE